MPEREPTPEQNEMEEARQGLERQAGIQRQNENPMMPAETPIANDNKEWVISTPQPTPDEVIEQEKLGADQ